MKSPSAAPDSFFARSGRFLVRLATLGGVLTLAAAGGAQQAPKPTPQADAPRSRPAGPAGAPAAAAGAAPAEASLVGGQAFGSLRRRDPFLNPLLLIKQHIEIVDEEVDLGTPPPGINGMLIRQVELLGTSQSDGRFTAVFRGTDKRSYFLRESDRLFDGFVKQITADAVTMVREIRKRSGKVERQEITKQLRKQS